MFMFMVLFGVVARLVDAELPPSPPLLVVSSPTTPTPCRSTRRSIETLVVVIAVITIVGVIAGIIARICGGRHFGGSGENDIEGWVERRCRSCIDGGVPTAPPSEASKPATTAEAKK
ncbi:hypothetical protein Syun_017502 [Stephania yunnanensis]|uniref:Transmembrane protein n=1 Tax=Stephania yunnanensis TaxID=152371 RepID=A0AAP0J7Z6_9MAGN